MVVWFLFLKSKLKKKIDTQTVCIKWLAMRSAIFFLFYFVPMFLIIYRTQKHEISTLIFVLFTNFTSTWENLKKKKNKYLYADNSLTQCVRFRFQSYSTRFLPVFRVIWQVSLCLTQTSQILGPRGTCGPETRSALMWPKISSL